MRSTPVLLDTTARVLSAAGDAQSVVGVTLVFDPADPFAVSMTFHDQPPRARLGAVSSEVTWTFARALLEDGLHGPSGQGDVTVTPAGQDAVLHVRLSSPQGCVVVLLDWDMVALFLDASLSAVPAGAESVDWDPVLAQILATGDPHS
jgi:hypothetical protein